MGYLSRNKVYEKIPALKEAKKLFIFCEGETTEVQYFKYFQGFSSNIDIFPIPCVAGKSDPTKLKENADLLFSGNDQCIPKYKLSTIYNDEVWFVIDTDNWNIGDKINLLKEYCKTKNEVSKAWYIAQSNPCFEIWLYYHFKESKPELAEVNKCASFKDYVGKQIRGGFNPKKMPIELQKAITNSKNNFDHENDQPKLYSTEVHNLGDCIFSFIKEPLNKCLQALKESNQS